MITLLSLVIMRSFTIGAISSSNNKALKLVNQFIYLGSNISSTESNVHLHRSKALLIVTD